MSALLESPEIRDVASNYTTAVKWLRKAADQGVLDSQEMLGHAYEFGLGVQNDYVEAANWYRRAAEQGDMVAQMSLAIFYQNGTGVPKNNVEAYKWFNLAAAQSGKNENERKCVEVSTSGRDLMVQAGEITSEEIAEAQRLSDAFVPRKRSHLEIYTASTG